MGFFAKLFGLPSKCPACGTENAKVSFLGTRCPAANCIFYDAMYAQELRRRKPKPTERSYVPVSQRIGPTGPPQLVDIEYVNYKNEQKTFSADRRTMRIKNAHLSVCVAPANKRIALRISKIINRDVVEDVAASGPSPREMYILNYHRSHGTTSALYESIAQKYPDC